MNFTPLALAVAFLLGSAPVAAAPPGNYSITFEFLVFSYFDFKDGFGIADPSDENSPCIALLLGVRIPQPIAITWEGDQNMGTNINGPGFGINRTAFSPPLGNLPPGSWLPASQGFNTGVPCPSHLGGSGNIWFIWSGANWRSVQSDSSANLFLCTQTVFASGSPGCIAFPSATMRLVVSACTSPPVTFFDHNYLDGKGKYVAGQPFDTLAMKNTAMRCTSRHAHDYTATIQDFSAGGAGQTFDLIKNESVVHAGSGTTYMAVCWRVEYQDFSNPLAPTPGLAQAHDWKLIVDVASLPDAAAVLPLHYGGQQPGDGGVGPATVALRGFYDADAGAAGQNGFGPCPTTAVLPEAKKPDPGVHPPHVGVCVQNVGCIHT